MTGALETQAPRVEAGDGLGAIFSIVAPVPTARAIVPRELKRALAGRQNGESDCGALTYTYSDSDKTFPWHCDGQNDCSTLGDYFNCGTSVLWTSCATAQSDCDSTRLRLQTRETDVTGIDSTSSEFPYCMAAVQTRNGDEYTNWNCADYGASGTFEVRIDDVSTTSTTTTTTTTTTTESTTESESRTGTATTTSGTSTSTRDPVGGGGGGSSTPVGAIVGGVIGGVALIALIAFLIWFIRFQKRKSARAAAAPGVSPSDAPPVQYNGQQQYGAGYYPVSQNAPSNMSQHPPSVYSQGAQQGYQGYSPPPLGTAYQHPQQQGGYMQEMPAQNPKGPNAHVELE